MSLGAQQKGAQMTQIEVLIPALSATARGAAAAGWPQAMCLFPTMCDTGVLGACRVTGHTGHKLIQLTCA